MSITSELKKARATKRAIEYSMTKQGVPPTGLPFCDWPALVSQIGGDATALQTKTAIPAATDVEVTPDDGITGLLKVLIEADINHKPYNIMDGITIHGVTGTAKPYVMPGDSAWPFPDADDTDPSGPPSEDAMDGAAQEDDPDVNTEDKMVLVDNAGNITTGYLYTEPDSGLMVYGGAVLPDIDSVYTDELKATHPYVIIFGSSTVRRMYLLSAYTFDYIENGESKGEWAVKWGYETQKRYTNYSNTDPYTWVEQPATSDTAKPLTDIIWANFDLLNEDGSVYLKASEPTEYTGFTITHYDPTTTEFRAIGWRRVSKHTTGELAGQITKDDFTRQESGGWNYLKNIRSCTREKLYYKGVEVWPTDAYKDSRWNYGEGTLQSLGALPPTIAQYPYAIIRYTGMIIHELFMSTVPFTVVSEGTGMTVQTYLRSTQAGSAIYYIENDGAQDTDEFWVRDTSKNTTFGAGENVYRLTLGIMHGWANYEVYNEEGTAVYDTPEPVLVQS